MSEKNDEWKKQQFKLNLVERKKEASMVRKIVAIICVILFFLFIVVSVSGYFYLKSTLKPVDPQDDKPRLVEIPVGSGTTSIGTILEEKGIIKSALVFKYYVKLNNEHDFQAGTYQLSPSLSLKEIIDILKSGKTADLVTFTIPEGLSLEEIAAIIAKKTDYKKEDIVKKVKNHDYLNNLIQTYPNLLTEDIFKEDIKHPLEGYFYPATYSFKEKNPKLEQMIGTMLEKTDKVITKYIDTMEKKNLNIHELLTIASLIEKEATEKADRRKIASVFYNRMEEEMPLQTDPTVLYALGEHKERVLYKHLEIDDPYNTYLMKGLPPGPISNAGETSIKAALNPEKTEFFYFLAETDTGKVYYSTTLKEHNKKKAKYITNKNKE